MSNWLDKRALACIALLSVACTGKDVLLTTAGAGTDGVVDGSAGAMSGGPNGGVGGAAEGPASSAGAAGEISGGGAAMPERELNSFIDVLVPGAGRCLPRALPLNDDLSPNCKILAASASCDCTAAGRAPASDAETSAARAQLAAEGACGGAAACSSFCVCEVSEATGASEQDCLTNPAPAASSTGWCYVAPAAGIGSAALVSDCPSSHKQKLQFLGDAQPGSGETLFLACAGGPVVSPPRAAMHALGAPCIGGSEYDPSFEGFNAQEVSVDLGSPSCASGVCLANHFQGRASCPYGQQASEGGCFVPGSDTPVVALVSPQLVTRKAATASVCSCRCAGPGPGPFCSCGSGMQCLPLIDDFGLPGESAYAGSYCVASGTGYDPSQVAAQCNSAELNCGPARPD